MPEPLAAPPRLGVSFTGCRLELAQVRRLVGRADELGYAVVLVDGDASLLPRRPDAPIYDSTALLAAALRATRRAHVGSIRLPAFWNAALLARSLATLQELGRGRVLAVLGVGAGRHECRLGLSRHAPRERVRHLDELAGAVRALLAGETVSVQGRYVKLCDVSIAPPPSPVPIVVAAARPGALRVAERHADVWDANVPPVAERFLPLRERLSRSLETWIWIFARPGSELDAAVAAYRRTSPWFSELPDEAMRRALLWGDPGRCADRLDELRRTLGIDVPIVDLAGLDEAAAARALAVLAPAGPRQIP